MTTREKVLVLAMAGAALWGGTTVGLGYYKKNQSAEKVDLRKAEIRTFAESQRVRMAPLRLSAAERMALNEAAGPWQASPFIDRAATAEVVAAPVEQFFYTGFIQVGAQRFAILNDREYRVSEPVAQTDFRLESIQPDQVVLVSGSGGRRLTIALQTTKEKRELP